ncbi:MAG: hypothetical protein K6T86_04680 [Pirellulales bacterium]|nr:hypothetical protein [Pirellulales bacterium]
MDIVTQKDLKRLLERQAQAVVSLYMPTEPVGPQTPQNLVRLRKLLHEARTLLEARGMRSSEAKQTLSMAEDLLLEEPFWRSLGRGLALFTGHGRLETYRIPYSVPELVVAHRRFHIRPLLPLLTLDGQFAVLAASLKQVRLFVGTQQQLVPAEVELPQGLSEVLAPDTPQRVVQVRSTARLGKRKEGAVYHGQGGATEHLKKELAAYFRKVDRAVTRWLGTSRMPLVFAGVDYLFPLYRETCTYAALHPEPLVGNPDHLDDDELRKRAWELVHPLFSKAVAEALGRYQELAGSGQTSAHLEEILTAASEGSVDTLLVAREGQVWGAFQEDGCLTHLHAERRATSEDLLNTACVLVLEHSGRVLPVEQGQLPVEDHIAAIYRYPRPAGRPVPAT